MDLSIQKENIRELKKKKDHFYMALANQCDQISFSELKLNQDLTPYRQFQRVHSQESL